MYLYFAASISHEKRYKELRPLIQNRLTSYALTSAKDMEFYRNELRNKDSKTILDSGAFSVWTKGKELDINAYISFCEANLDTIDYFVNLDVIPGKPYKAPTLADRKEAAKAGWGNYITVLKKIPNEKVIHVFHQGEDFKWLARLVKKGIYIGLSPANDKNTEQRVLWLDKCMKYVLNQDGYPLVKFHGFAVTSSRIIARYPWYSVDSATWIRRSAFGDIFIPKFVKGKPDYSITQDVVSFTERSVIRNGKKNNDHYSYASQKRKEVIGAWVSELGHTPEELHDDSFARLRCNILFYKKVQESAPIWPWSTTIRKGLNII